MGQDYGGRVKLLSQAPAINLELNDVRDAGSPKLAFYYQISLLVADDDDVAHREAISYHKMHNPTDVYGGQLAAVYVFAAPAAQEAHIWYQHKWPVTSRLLSVMFHAHNNVQQEAFLFNATGPELGLTLPPHGQVRITGTANLQVGTLCRRIAATVGMREAAPIAATVGWLDMYW